MISQQGRVVAVNGDEVAVRIGGVSGCPACDAGKGCGAGIFGRLLRNRQTTVQVSNSIHATSGQTVQLGISERSFLALVFKLYAWPLLAGLLGAIIGFAVATRSNQQGLALDMWSLIAGLVAAGIVLNWNRRRFREFPSNAAVHLLETADGSGSPDCASSNREDYENL